MMNPEPSTNHEAQLRDLPDDFVRYQLLPFIHTTRAVKLTQASHSLFHMLRFKIHRSEYVQSDRFIQQNQKSLNQIDIGMHCAVSVTSEGDLDHLMTHLSIAEVVKFCPLLSLRIDFDKPMSGTVLPTSVRTLTFSVCFNESLNQVTLPSSLHTLTFGSDFNQSLDMVTLPPLLHSHFQTASINHWNQYHYLQICTHSDSDMTSIIHWRK